ncbi:hypothetical protein [Synechocystis sp. FACHB-383]|nr:hypothetical protein [Synechocystis sp. FACHB-383]
MVRSKRDGENWKINELGRRQTVLQTMAGITVDPDPNHRLG